ncbi:UNVERIFIED_ORG: hypothetical protein ABIB63_000114 [Xanthomonas axonopodis]
MRAGATGRWHGAAGVMRLAPDKTRTGVRPALARRTLKARLRGCVSGLVPCAHTTAVAAWRYRMALRTVPGRNDVPLR